MRKALRSLYYRYYGRLVQRIDDIYSCALIKDFLPTKSYFPITGSSLGFHSIATIVNDLQVNNRCNVLEFGAGLSTVVLAKFASKHKPDVSIISIEHDGQYLQHLEAILTKEGCNQQVVFVKAELKRISVNNVEYNWYTFDEKDAVRLQKNFDLAIIDGPIYDRRDPNFPARYPAIQFIKERLATSYALYLDDAHRDGEQKLITLAQEEHGIQFRKISPTLAVATRGTMYNSIA